MHSDPTDPTPASVYELMAERAAIVATSHNQALSDVLLDVVFLLREARTLDGLTPSDARTVGVTLLIDLVYRGVDGLWWRAQRIHAVGNQVFDQPTEALDAHAKATALILGVAA
ncbi:hypothetical protein ABLE94_02955 [Gordonia sp. VNK1]|uniref:hypothetical protein n=1 Tax=Gordonia oleivorans TaxID=3156618 RepID=UPI0032B315DE